MAKSLRSKWRRKCRAVKRIRYGEKELARLKKTLGIDDSKPADEVMNDLNEIATVTNAEAIRKEQQEKTENENVEAMDDGTVKRVYNPRTMRDQFGNYPIWMNKRKLLKIKKKKNNKVKKIKEKNQKSKKRKGNK